MYYVIWSEVEATIRIFHHLAQGAGLVAQPYRLLAAYRANHLSENELRKPEVELFG